MLARPRVDAVAAEAHPVEEAPYYSPCRVRLDGRSALVAWYMGEPDGFLRDDEGRLGVYETLHDLDAEARSAGLTTDDHEPTDYDLDRIQAWCAAPDADQVDCKAFLNVWNFFDDLSGLHGGADTPYTRVSREEGDCYDRLFWGNNLPAVTPAGEHFTPSWSTGDLDGIARVMGAGLDLMREELGRAARHA